MTPKPVLVATLLAGLALGGCAQEVALNGPPAVPPPPSVEVIPKPPVTAQRIVWQPGHWNWNGTGYVWQPGEYVPLDGHGTEYMPGYWAQTPSGYQWQPAHWL